MLIDAHTHIRKEDVDNGILKALESADVYAVTAGTNPDECFRVNELAGMSNRIIPTYGLHPWYADKYPLSEMMKYLENCEIIGEIGMDRVWCQVELSCQQRIFVEQLKLAEKRGCPVLLHTKGQEREIAGIISEYSMPVIVHWYSSMDYLDEYLKRDCYFTIGPDVSINPAVQQVVSEAPLNRLLVESDGLTAIEWALGKKVFPADLPGVLQDNIAFLAEIKGVSKDKVQEEMAATFRKLVAVPGVTVPVT